MSTSQEKKLPSNRTYTVDDIAAILGIAKSTAYRLVNWSRQDLCAKLFAGSG